MEYKKYKCFFGGFFINACVRSYSNVLFMEFCYRSEIFKEDIKNIFFLMLF